MTRKTFAILWILIALLASLFSTVGAQSGTDPEVTPTAVPTAETETPGASFFTHPIVKLLSAYFDRNWLVDEEPVDPADPTVSPDPDLTMTPEPDATVTPEPAGSDSGLGPVGEEIAAYHEAGIGFGVLVKIYAMAEASEAACAEENAANASATDAGEEGEPADPVCTPVTAEELVTAYQSGVGMGQLMKEYGKPAMLGVGHVRKAAKNQAAQPTVEPTASPTAEPTLTPEGGEPEAEQSVQGQKGNGNQGKDKPNKGNPNKGNPDKGNPNRGRGGKK